MPFLPEALQSIRNQTYHNLEILCIDDGSTDETYKYLKEQADIDPRIVLVKNEQNMKLIATLNKGIQLAKGKYLARMDADDVSLPKRIEFLLNELIKSNVDLISSNFSYINVENQKVKSNILKATEHWEISIASFLFTPFAHAPLLGKRECFVQNPYQLSEKSIHVEDYELWTHLLRNKVKFKNLDHVLYLIRINSSSVSFKYENEQRSNFLFQLQNHWYLCLPESKNYSESSFEIIANRFPSITFRNYIKSKPLFQLMINSLSEDREKVYAKNIIALQLLDIQIQAVKKTKGVLKIYFVLQLLTSSLRALFKKESRDYFMNKFK
jgi:glycosyltransferase involved in cell wall biosynthesis